MMFPVTGLIGPTLARLRATHPRVWAECFVCEKIYETYRGTLTAPPEPDAVRDIHHIVRVDTCLDPYCERVEEERQQALFNSLYRDKKWHPSLA